jgi:hypothetical protein
VTVSANYTQEFQRDELLTLALQATGTLEAGEEPPAADLAMASNFLNLELQSLQAEKIVLRTVERATLTLTAGTAEYTLPADTIDVQLGPNDQLGTILPSAGGESIVKSMSRAEYADITDKTSTNTGRPTRAYVERLASITITLWPVPDAASTTLRYSRVRLLRDADDGAVTMDLARRWLKYVVYAVAVHIARSKSLGQEVVQDLRAEAELAKERCKEDDTQRGRLNFRIAHSGVRW